MLSFDFPGQFLGFGSNTTSYGTQDALGFVPTTPISTPFPNGLNPQTGSSEGLNTYVGLDAGQIWLKGSHPVGYTEQWSFDVQYQLGYQYQVLQPYPEFGALTVTRSLSGATSSYNALDLKYNRSFSSGLSAIVTYRWSKALDDRSEDLVGWTINSLWRDSYNTKLDYAVSTHDQPHSFGVAAVYDLPYGTGKRWGGSAPWALRQVLGNWQLSSNIRLSSGFPIYGVYNDGSSPIGNLYGFRFSKRRT
jgi:hypothetical protein